MIFKDNELGEQVWNNKYRYNNESYDEFIDRVSSGFNNEIANRQSIIKDNNDLSDYGKEFWYNPCNVKDLIIKTIIPGGSVLASVGTSQYTSLSNCFVIMSPGDSIEDIFEGARDIAQISKRRGGVGIDISNLRPLGANVNNSSKTSTGSISWMELYSTVVNTVGQNGRRGALMISIDVNHPDVEDFIKIKEDLSKVTGANISVKVTSEFMQAVETDSEFILKWPVCMEVNSEGLERNKLIEYEEGYVKIINAKDLWNSLVYSAWKSAEPGIINWTRMLDYDPSGNYPENRPISTNPCQPHWASVLTPIGVKQFIQIRKGHTVWTSEGWAQVNLKRFAGMKKVYEYRTEAGVFVGTEDHEIVSNGGKVKVKDAETIDTLVGPESRPGMFYPQVVMDGIVLMKGVINDESRKTCIPIRWFDEDYFESEIKEFIIKKDRGEDLYKVTTRIKQSELVAVYEREISFKYMYTSDDKGIRSLLRGMFSASSSVLSLDRITFKTYSRTIMNQVQILLSGLGIRSYCGMSDKPKRVKDNYGEYVMKDRYLVHISQDRELFYKLIGFIQEHKTAKVIEHLKGPGFWIAPHDKIISKKYIATEKVYNLSVGNESHTYWSGGLNVGNCGEVPLSAYDSCRLMAVNLYSLVNNPFTPDTCLDYNKLYQTFYKAQVMADVLVDLEIKAVEHIISKTDPDSSEYKLWNKILNMGKKARRTGTGITGYADMLAALGKPYGDSVTTEYVFKIKLQAELDASIDMAILFGKFENYDPRYENPTWLNFIDNNYPDTYKRMIKYGRRNISLSTIAPCGSISIISGNCSSGIEPVFNLSYTRRKKCNADEVPDFVDDNGVGYTEHQIVHQGLRDWANITGRNINDVNPYTNQTANDINWETRVKTQALMQKYITHSISSTVNLPEDTTIETVDNIYKEAFKLGCKGLTVYRDNSRSGILVATKSERPEILDCKVIHFKNDKRDWIAFIGLLNDKPFELFTGPRSIDEFPVPSTIKSGKIIRVKFDPDEHARYDFIYYDNFGFENRLGGLSRIFNKEYWNYARFVSALLRGQHKIPEIIRILEGLEFENRSLSSWKNGVIRAIKEYIEDGTYVEKETCPECNSKLTYQGGCKTCSSCGWSKCI